MKFRIYCDGSCRNNGATDAIGAWGYIVINDTDEVITSDCDICHGTTNQRMELEALIHACQAGDLFLSTTLDEIEVFTDSAYAHNCMDKRWYENWQRSGWVNSKKQPVANRDLWEKLIPYFTNVRFKFYKCKGHADDKYNNMVDNMVQKQSAAARGGN